ncbi:MAG TPA: alpha/beta hydrolase [Caulobacteraceae bacterium]|jgi:pimeloyl-ACP methyl ester carboxylesterase
MNRRQMLAVALAASAVAAPALGAPAWVDDFASDRFTVRLEGEGPDVILIPGLSSSPEIWDKLVAHWGGRVRTHRIHVNGFSGAPAGGNGAGTVAAPVAEEIARYIRETSLSRPAVIGHSMGGAIGLMLAARHPAAVGKLMVVDMLPALGPAFAGPTATPEQIAATADRVAAGIRADVGEGRAVAAQQAITGMVRTEGERAGPIRHMMTSEPDVMARSMRELIVTDLTAEIAAITAPTTVLYVAFPGMADMMVDMIYRGAYRNLAGARLVRYDDSAHFIMLDQPARFHAEADAFLSAE